ncbi:hypothetical protein B0H13DRAFT_2304417 [Mycena leptocephala]|nr:hypothetical protein B0H13DRAFT_2304417 [Mycena leptocephala]
MAVFASMGRILQSPIPDAILSRIQGNAAREVKEIAVKWLNIYHAPPNCFAGASTRRTAVTEVSLNRNALDNGNILTLTLGVEILDGQSKVSNAFIITIIDDAVTTHDFAEGGPGISGVSLSLDTVFHNPVELGAKLCFVNTTLTAVGGTTSCRCEVWDLTQRRLVATATFVGMGSSPPKAPARL